MNKLVLAFYVVLPFVITTNAITCKYGWNIDVGVRHAEWMETNAVCTDGDYACIRIEANSVSPKQGRYFGHSYRCHPTNECSTVQENCKELLMDVHERAGVEKQLDFFESVQCNAACCTSENCNALPLESMDHFQLPVNQEPAKVIEEIEINEPLPTLPREVNVPLKTEAQVLNTSPVGIKSRVFAARSSASIPLQHPLICLLCLLVFAVIF